MPHRFFVHYKREIDLPEKNLVATTELAFLHPKVSLTVTHNFGSTKVKGKRSRSLGTEEEKERLTL